MRIACIDSEAGMRDLLPEWTALWRRVPGATPFQSPAWLLAWWRHFATGTPKILTSRSTGTLVGALPLYVRVEGTACKLLPIGIGLSDYLDALVDPQYPDAARELFEAIAGIAGWHECHLPDLPPGAQLATAPCPAGLRETGGPTVPCPVLPLPPSADDLGRVVPRKTLRDLRQAAARAAALGTVEIARADAASLSDTMGELFRLHEKRWQSRGEGGVCADPAARAFHCDAAATLADAGLLRLYRLAVGGETMAVYYGCAHDRRAYAYLGGFDPDRPRLSPGAQVLHHAIVEAIAENCTEFHFLRGGEPYKYAWGAVDQWNRARTLRRP